MWASLNEGWRIVCEERGTRNHIRQDAKFIFGRVVNHAFDEEIEVIKVQENRRPDKVTNNVSIFK